MLIQDEAMKATPPLSGAPDSIIDHLRTILPASRVLSRFIDRVAYASDASFYRLIPQVVVQPSSVEEIRRLFAASHRFRIAMTFRAAGTSLSGQAVSDGILVDISKTWNKITVEDSGKRVRVLPGVVGQMVNEVLRPYGAKLGPDPASINACMIGGIIANNSSGMCCGVQQNSYHTIESMKFVLPDGIYIDTALRDADAEFHARAPKIAGRLLEMREQILADAALCEKIRTKYRLKNTTGYSINAFLDYSGAVEIMERLLIGSEGTLGFIAEAVFHTVPDLPFKYTGLLIFETIEDAAASIPTLEKDGAAALEIMDRASLASIEEMPGLPKYLAGLPIEAYAILVEYQAAAELQIEEAMTSARRIFSSLPLLHPPDFTRDSKQQAVLWKVRKGLFPAVGANKPRGTTVIIEDVAFPVASLAAAVRDLRILFAKYGFEKAIIFGHAKDGNLHFVITPDFGEPETLKRYADFMRELADIVVGRYGGSLKAEHGTGRNMAPFVEQEWGKEAYRIMRQLKELVDPENLLNPGVIINPDPDCFISDIKDLPRVEEEVDRCIECGFCEPKCPSRNFTLSPRQRIVLRREVSRLQTNANGPALLKELKQDYLFAGMDSCAADGLCALACPVSIDTGALITRLRREAASATGRRVSLLCARHLAAIEKLVRASLRLGHGTDFLFGPALTGGISRFFSALPQWIPPMPKAAKRLPPRNEAANAAAVYLPSCISRTMGKLPEESSLHSVPEVILLLAGRAGLQLLLPQDAAGVCCGTPFSSKGYDEAYGKTVSRAIERCYEWSREGVLPIVLDTSPCAYKFRTCRNDLPDDLKRRFDKLTFLDGIEFAHDFLLPLLSLRKLPGEVAIHPVCSAQKLNIQDKLKAVCGRCSESVFVPNSAGCCGFAGDRGFLLPELSEAALENAAEEISQRNLSGFFSSSRTCEIGLSRSTGKAYRSFFYLLEEASR